MKESEAGRKLPKGWRWARLGDHVTKVGSGVTPRGGQASYQRSGVPLIRSQNVHMNRFVAKGIAFISPEQDGQLEGSRVLPGDILLNITGASIGRVCVVPKEVCPANVNQHVSIIRSDGSFDPAFISYFLSIPDFQKYILDSQAGATRQALTKTLIEDFRIPMPPLSEQRRIAALLKEQMAAVERARAATQAQLEAAKTLPAAYLRAVFNSPEAQGWPRSDLSEMCDLLPAKSITLNGDFEGNIITTACLTESGFQPSGIRKGRMWKEDFERCVVSPGEVLIARSNTIDLVGRVAMYSGNPKGLAATDLTIRILPKAPLRSQFLSSYLSFLYLSGYWKNHASGASGSMKKIRREQILKLKIPVPSASEQDRFIGRIPENMATINKAHKYLAEQNNQIDKLPAALLRRAFNGEL